MKQILTIIFLLLFVNVNCQEKNTTTSDLLQNNSTSKSDFSIVLKSLKKSNEIKNLLENKKGLVIKTINNQLTDFDEYVKIFDNKRLISYASSLNENINEYIIIECVIYYSTYEILIKFRDANSKRGESLKINLIQE